jgi:hypothetical protein
MATYQILYWQDIPSQLKVWDDSDEIKLELPPRFAERIDHAAQTQGQTSTDDYLSHWKWSEEEDRPGTAAEVAELLKKELEQKFK